MHGYKKRQMTLALITPYIGKLIEIEIEKLKRDRFSCVLTSAVHTIAKIAQYAE